MTIMKSNKKLIRKLGWRSIKFALLEHAMYVCVCGGQFMVDPAPPREQAGCSSDLAKTIVTDTPLEIQPAPP
jgi:hypothetical protein